MTPPAAQFRADVAPDPGAQTFTVVIFVVLVAIVIAVILLLIRAIRRNRRR
jgi:hypothetical protein